MTQPPPPEITVRDLVVTYDTGRRVVHALGPLSLDIARGEFISVVGPSGCGKTTLARVIAGLLPLTAGGVVITSRETTAVVPVATVFQDNAIFPWKTVIENVRFGLVVNGVNAREATRTARAWIDRVGLTDFEGAYPQDLSGGMQQRVGIARAFAVEPDVLILDEPFGSLDAQLREILQEELLDLHQEIGCTVILITHSLEEALVLSDRVAVLSARPGILLTIAEVPFDRPRRSTVRQTPLFTEMRQGLWNTLRIRWRWGGPAATMTKPEVDALTTPPGTTVPSTPRGAMAQSPLRHSRYVGLILPVFLLTLWEILARVGFIDAAYFPPPSRIAARAMELARSGDLLADFTATLLRIVIGFAIGAVVGYATGIATGVFVFARRLLEPTLSAIYTVPKIALLPILLLIFGFGEAPKVTLVAVTVFFYVWIYTMEAVVRIPVGYVDAAASFRANRWQVFVHVIGPGTLPAVFTGLRIAVAVSVLVTISSDFIIGDSGLGYLIFNSRALFRLEDAFVGILAVAVLGYVLQSVVVLIGNRVTPWSHHSTVASAKVRV